MALTSSGALFFLSIACSYSRTKMLSEASVATLATSRTFFSTGRLLTGSRLTSHIQLLARAARRWQVLAIHCPRSCLWLRRRWLWARKLYHHGPVRKLHQ